MKLTKSQQNTLKVFAILLLIVVGSILRIYGLSNQSLWYDEIVTWSISNKSSLGEVWNEISNENRPPLHQILYFFVIKFLGDNEFALRLPSAIFGILSILLIYLLALKLFSFKEAILSSAFMTFFWAPIYYSQEARDYSLLIMLTIAAVYLWVEIHDRDHLSEKIKLLNLFVFALLLALLAYTHYFGLFFDGLLFFGTILLFWKNRKVNYKVLLSYLIAVILYIPWLKGLIFQASKLQNFWIKKPTLSSVYDVIFYLYATEPVLFYIIIAFLLFSFVQLIYTLFKKVQPEQNIHFLNADLLLWLWFLLPIIIIFIQSLLTKSLFLERYFLICLPAAYILLSRAILNLPLNRYIRYAIATIMILYISFDLFYLQDYYNKPVKKTQIREATEFLIANYKITPDAIIIGFSIDVELINDSFHYYFIQKNSPLRLDYFMSTLRKLKDLEQYIESRHPMHIWLIYADVEPPESLITLLKVKYKYIHGKYLYKSGALLFKQK